MENSVRNMENLPRRTPILWILAIVTMISAGSSIVTYLAWAINPQMMLQNIELVKTSGIVPADLADAMIKLYSQIKNWQFLLMAAVEVMFFAGAFIMLAKLSPIGFHIYTVGKLLQFCLMNFVIGGSVAMDVNAIVTAVLWVLMYATQLRFMRPLNSESIENQDNRTDNE